MESGHGCNGIVAMSALNWELGRRTVFRLSVGPIAPHPRGLG